jgi:hypothetical protein
MKKSIKNKVPAKSNEVVTTCEQNQGDDHYLISGSHNAADLSSFFLLQKRYQDDAYIF